MNLFAYYEIQYELFCMIVNVTHLVWQLISLFLYISQCDLLPMAVNMFSSQCDPFPMAVNMTLFLWQSI